MKTLSPSLFCQVLSLCLWIVSGLSPALAERAPVTALQTTVNRLDNQACLACHDGRKKLEVSDTSPGAAGQSRLLVNIVPDLYAQGVHAQMACLDCHRHITSLQPPHQVDSSEKIECGGCHERLAKEREKGGAASVDTLLNTIKTYQHSIHARPNQDDPTVVNASCHDCHDSHFYKVFNEKNSPAYANWRLTISALCGKCHADEQDDYAASAHGVALLKKHNSQSATCIDCHVSHEITSTRIALFQLASLEVCGTCHKKQFNSYQKFFHGQLAQHGYHSTAKCFDCHEHHKTVSVTDPQSTIHPKNRLKRCQSCHDGLHRPLATAGFASFTPHAHAMDYGRYPQVWISSRGMMLLLWGVMLFFGFHSGLWYYREWQERKKMHSAPPVDSACFGKKSTQHIRRFPLIWRVAHLLFALLVMLLLLTGMTFLYAQSDWALVIAQWLGGVEEVRVLHRVAALQLVCIFVVHLVYILPRLLRDRQFDWFGPDSLLPNRKDFTDCRDMLRWFFGKGEKPQFDRWTYYEKFDYWAVFWGMLIIGGSGVVLAFPHIAGIYLEGWVFNVALLVHGEEAFLAALFLFTIHFFNNHFRPNKWPPPDVVMFTGSHALEVLQRDHPAQFARLQARGHLDNTVLVKPPSTAMLFASNVLGLLLILIGLTLLFLMVSGRVG